MSQIQDLIEQFCPDGVEYKKLEDVSKIRNGRDYKHLNSGDVPVYGSGGIMTYVDTASGEGPSVLIPRKGSIGNVFYVEDPFWNIDTVFRTEIDDSQILPRFFFYAMESFDLESLAASVSAGRPSLTQTILNDLPIPVPPIEVQRAIVEALDSFVGLERELRAELDMRTKQYERYRQHLLGQPTAQWIALGEICKTVVAGGDKPDDLNPIQTLPSVSHPYPVFSNGIGGAALSGFSKSCRIKESAVTISARGTIGYHTVREAGFTPVIRLIALVPRLEICSAEYLNYALFATEINGDRGGIPQLTAPKTKVIKVPIVPLAEQARIVLELSYFESLIDSLEHEVNVRHSQCEHYRNQLLALPRKDVA